MRKSLHILSALLLYAVLANAAILRVSPNGSAPYTTIMAAYTAAVNGDTIVVGPGTYTDPITSTKRLKVIGAGWDQASTYYWYFNTGSTGSSLEGLYMQNSGASDVVYAYATADSITISRCWLYSNHYYCGFERQASTGKWSTIQDCIFTGYYAINGQDFIRAAGDSMIVRNCLFAHPSSTVAGQCVVDGAPRFLSMTNNVCVNVREIFNLTGTFGMYAANNVVWDWNASGTWGTYSPTATLEYNASATPAPPGSSGITLAADPFVNYTEANGFENGISDFHPAAGSPLIDAGVPTLLDRDGSRSDLGIYGGPYQFVENGAPAYPFVISVIAPAAIVSGDSLSVSTTGRVGPRY